jgi:hypothetical protein
MTPDGPRYIAPDPGQVGQRLQVRMPPDYYGSRTRDEFVAQDPDRARNFGWNVAGTPDPGQPVD